MIRDTLLIIDDSELDLAILNEIFKGLFRVECVAESRRGLTYLHHNMERVCAVLLDICLERRGAGFTVLHQLQGNPDTASLPVILITTDANEKDVRASVERGAVDFLVKPVDPHTVQERVCSIVRAAWPPKSTILDHKPEPEAQKAPEPAPDLVQIFPQGLPLAAAQLLCRDWADKLGAFYRLRPSLDMDAHRQLGGITTLLAQCYTERFPEQGPTQEEAELIGLAATFCDIGLLGIPDHILEEGEDQDGPDAQLYYQHTQLGYDLFRQLGEDLPLFQYAAEIALWHHKNADGSGYPTDAGAGDVPLCAQLTRAALRLQRYLHYYRGCADGTERVLRTLKGEVGTVISPEIYQAVELAGDRLQAVLRNT